MKKLNRGFSIIELLIVVSIVGIMAITIITTFRSTNSGVSSIAQRDSLMSTFSYARNLAIAKKEITSVRVSTNYYTVQTESGSISETHEIFKGSTCIVVAMLNNNVNGVVDEIIYYTDGSMQMLNNSLPTDNAIAGDQAVVLLSEDIIDDSNALEINTETGMPSDLSAAIISSIGGSTGSDLKKGAEAVGKPVTEELEETAETSKKDAKYIEESKATIESIQINLDEAYKSSNSTKVRIQHIVKCRDLLNELDKILKKSTNPDKKEYTLLLSTTHQIVLPLSGGTVDLTIDSDASAIIREELIKIEKDLLS